MKLLDDVHENPLGAGGLPDSQGLGDGSERVWGITLSGQDASQTVKPIAVPRPDLQKLPVNGAGLGETSLVLEQGAEIVQRRPNEARRQRKRPADMGFGFLERALLPQSGAEIVMRLGIAQLQGKRLAITGRRLIQFVLLIKQRAEIVMRAGQAGLKGQGTAIAGLGFFQLPLLAKRIAQIVVRCGQSLASNMSNWWYPATASSRRPAW